LAGHDYRAVGSAEEALQAVEQESFSLVVSDVNMPGMDGHQLLGLLRARQPQLPVLLMTAHGAVERAVDAMRQGAADYLVKPFEPKALIELVARHALGSRGVLQTARARLLSSRPVRNCWSWRPRWPAVIPRC
jgi:two-component system, response regulator FlrC